MFRRTSDQVESFAEDSSSEKEYKSNTLENVLIVFNILVGVIGLALTIVGILIVCNSPIKKLLEERGLDPLSIAGACIIILGFICIVGTIFGCCGAYKRNKCLLIFQIVIVSILIFIFLIAFGWLILWWGNYEPAFHLMKNQMFKSVAQYDSQTDSIDKTSWDVVHQKLECCGVESYKDWPKYNDRFNSVTFPRFPDSCCVDESEDESGNTCAEVNRGKFYSEGCFSLMEKFLKNHFYSIVVFLGINSLLMSITLILGSIIVCCR